jgi:hypothetical protein
VRENSGVASQILRDLQADDERIRGEIIGLLSGGPVGRTGGLISIPSGGTVSSAAYTPSRATRVPPVALLVAGWLLFAGALGIGVLVGWAIWG